MNSDQIPNAPDDSTAQASDRSSASDADVIETIRVREVVGAVFNSRLLEDMIVELTEAGVDRGDIDLMASWNTVISEMDLTYPDARAILDMPNVPRRRVSTSDEKVTITGTVFGTLIATGALAAGVPVLASGGALAAVLVASAAGGGLGAALAKTVRKVLTKDADTDAIARDIDRGGLAVFVRVDTPDEEQRAIKIMRRNGATNVHAHEVELPKRLSDLPLANVQPDPWLGEP